MRNEIIELRLSLIFAASFTCFHFILIKFYFFFNGSVEQITKPIISFNS
jgi:hypothetical protein